MKDGGRKPARTANPRSKALTISVVTFAVVVLLGVAQGLTVQEIGFGPLKIKLGRTAKGAAPPTLASSSTTKCILAEGAPGTVQPRPSSSGDLFFCPVQANGGLSPTTSRYFKLLGQILGPDSQRRTLALIVYGDPQTCDVLGNPPPKGGFLKTDFSAASPTGVWSFIDDVGYDEAVSIGRTYQYLETSAAAFDAMKRDPANWAAAHPGQENDYPGISALPEGVSVLADFYVAGNPTVKRTKPCAGQ